MSSQRLSPASFVKLSQDVASFYGFRPLREIEKSLPGASRRGAHNFATASTALALSSATPGGEPVMGYYASGSPLHVPYGLVPREVGEFGLQVSGATESVGEVLLLKTVATILGEWGGITRVRINALGDKDSRMRFARELSGYLRRQAHNLPVEWQARAAVDPMAFYVCTEDACRVVQEQGPRAMNFLSEKSRAHFKEMLEHLEQLGLPYELDDTLVGDEREPRVVFAIDTAADATVVGTLGGRYDDHVRKITGRKDASAVHASVFFRKKGLTASNFVLEAPHARPKLYFVQLGLRAKLKGLEVSNILREARIPVLQSFDSTRLSPQLQAATNAKVSHLIIMGQREALDGTVIVRAADNSAQSTLSLRELPRYLKTL